MNLNFGTDIASTLVTRSGTPNDVICTVTNKLATVAQIQTALAKISTFVGKMGAAGDTLKARDGQGGATSN